MVPLIRPLHQLTLFTATPLLDFADKSVVTKLDGESLIGTTRDGTPFTMNFADAKGGSTTGTIVIDDSK